MEVPREFALVSQDGCKVGLFSSDQSLVPGGILKCPLEGAEKCPIRKIVANTTIYQNGTSVTEDKLRADMPPTNAHISLKTKKGIAFITVYCEVPVETVANFLSTKGGIIPSGGIRVERGSIVFRRLPPKTT